MVKTKQNISIVVPVFNEYDTIKEFHTELDKTMARCLSPYEIIYVDDNSTDGTYEWLESLTDQSVKVLKKNSIKGKAYSLSQGLTVATGSVLVMLDGDLQYPPSMIPQLIEGLSTSDIMVAERVNDHRGGLGKFLSKGFKSIGKRLFGLKTDVKSGMKAFTREVYETIKTNPTSALTFDLEFLYMAQQAGFIIKNVPITTLQRTKRESKLSVMDSVLEIGTNALFIKLKRAFYIPILPKGESMRGAGIGHKKNKYITHTTLPVKMSAIKTFSFTQKVILLGTPVLLLLLLYLFPLPTARYVVGALSILYFIDALFNIFVILRSMSQDYELKITDDEIESLIDGKLPVYSILCPLYKEAHVVPQFLESIAKIDWPKEKLDVLFLLEEDDSETIDAFAQMTLPYYARTVIVPNSQPKNKTKSL